MLFSKHNERKLTDKEKKEASQIVEKLKNNVEKDYPEEDIARAEKRAEEKYKSKKALSGIWDKIQVLFFIAKHPSVWGLPVAVPAAVAILYLVLPFDAIPDIIAPLGLIDDIAVITGTIAAIIKTVSSYSREKLLAIRKECPENLLDTFDEMFGLETPLPVAEETQECEVIVETPVEAAAHSIEKGLFKTKKAINRMRRNLDAESENNPRIKESRLYKAVSRVDDVADAIPLAGNTIALRALEVYLNLEILKKGIKSLISFILFALSLFFFALKDDSIFFLVISSLFMLSSYTFLFISIFKNIPRIWSFITGYFKGGLEEAVVSVLFKRAEREPSLKEELVRTGVKRLKNDRELLTVIYKNFGSSLIFFLIKMVLIIAAFFATKRVVLITTGLHSTFDVLFAPIVEIVRIINQ